MGKKMFTEEYKEEWRCGVCNCLWDETVKHYSEQSKFNKALCNKHYCQMIQQGKITDKSRSRRHEPQICDICKDSNNVAQITADSKYNGYLLCSKHKSQVAFYGEILIRTKFDKNEIKLLEDWAEISLYDINNNISGITLIDLDDVEKVSVHKWHLLKNGYVYSSSAENYLHKYITPYKIVDHQNRNRLDNRKKNLRNASKSENAMNTSKSVLNNSGFIGVGWLKRKSRWCAKIQYKGKIMSDSSFTNKEDAIRQRLTWEKKFFKEFAPQKHLFEEYGIGKDVYNIE